MDDSRKAPQNQQDSVKGLNAVQNNKGTDEKETQEKYVARVEEEQRKRREELPSNQGELGKRFQSMGDAEQKSREEQVAKIEEEQEKKRKELLKKCYLVDKTAESESLDRRKSELSCSDSDLSGPSYPSGWNSNGDKEQDKQSFAPIKENASIEATYGIDFDEELRNCKNEPVNFQTDNGKRSKSPDSAYGSKSSSPLCFGSETEKPQVPASLQEEPSVTKVNNVDSVNSRA